VGIVLGMIAYNVLLKIYLHYHMTHVFVFCTFVRYD